MRTVVALRRLQLLRAERETGGAAGRLLAEQRTRDGLERERSSIEQVWRDALGDGTFDPQRARLWAGAAAAADAQSRAAAADVERETAALAEARSIQHARKLQVDVAERGLGRTLRHEASVADERALAAVAELHLLRGRSA